MTREEASQWHWRPWNEAAWQRNLELAKQSICYVTEMDVNTYVIRNGNGRMVFLNVINAKEFEQTFSEDQLLQIQFGNQLITSLDFIKWPADFFEE